LDFPAGPLGQESTPAFVPQRRHPITPPGSSEPRGHVANDRAERPSDPSECPPEFLTCLVTPEEAAQRLRISRAQVYVLLRAGSLESVQIGRSRRIPIVALADFVRNLREKADS
jgi:excisionase family DNA binding protein